jgi:spore coat polysaccharide biosynthesis protein SpsF (cytidylyltransferase family)
VKIDDGIDYVSFSRHNKGPKGDILKKKKKRKKEKKTPQKEQQGYKRWVLVSRIESLNGFHRFKNKKKSFSVKENSSYEG